jgi:hypothetical protein
MKRNWHVVCLTILILFGFAFAGCHPRRDIMDKAEKGFIHMVDKTGSKLDLNENQKVQLGQLKLDIRKNFQEGKLGKRETFIKIKEEGIKENPDLRKMTSQLQGVFKDDAQRINSAFDLMLDFQKNLNETQQKKLTQMVSDWVKKWD